MSTTFSNGSAPSRDADGHQRDAAAPTAAARIASVRNVAVCGHGSAGKTTLVDRLLVQTGEATGSHSVDDGTSICDFDDEERKHHHSVEAADVHFDHAGRRFHVLDTPGYPELIGQTISALHGVDTALIAVDAHAGVKVNTCRVWREAGHAGVPRLLVVTKLDDAAADLPAVMASIQEHFGAGCVLFNAPDGVGMEFTKVVDALGPAQGESAVVDLAGLHERAVETIVEVDDDALERYLGGEEPGHDELARLTVDAMKLGHVTPVVCCSAKTGVGVPELLDFLAEEAFSPADAPRAAAIDGAAVTLAPNPDGPLAAQVFRTRIDPFVQKLSFVRVFSGRLRKDTVVPIAGSAGGSAGGSGVGKGVGSGVSNGVSNGAGGAKGVKIGQLFSVQADKVEPVDEAVAGDIVAVAKCDALHTGMSLGGVELPAIPFPHAMVGLAVSPKTRGDEAKLAAALHKLVEEDPTVHVEHDPETHETVVSGMSELHLGLVRERLARRDHVEIETHEPKVPYRETITRPGAGHYRHKKQSGGAGQFAEVHLRMQPLPEGIDPEAFATKDRFPQLKASHYHERNHFLWIDSVVGGSIPGNFMPAIEKGFLEQVTRGVVAGCPVQNVCVEVHFGKDHPVDSNETAFKTAAARAFAEVFAACGPALLEPTVRLEVTAPTDSVGDISSDLSSRRGQIVGMTQHGTGAPGGMTTMEARAPLAELATYARTLSGTTGGQGSYTMELAGYEPAPGHVRQAVVARSDPKRGGE